MKTLKSILITAALFATFQVSAQTDKATTTKLVDALNFKFNATSALPLAMMDVNAVLNRMPGGLGGGAIQLTGAQYQLSVDKDSVEAYLPYYGRAYTAPMNPNDSGIKFNSKDFTYKTQKKKKGNWIITIKPKNAKDVQSLTLNISENGYAFLNVNSNNKQAISFNGYISEPVTDKQ